MKQILCFGDSNTWGLIPGEHKRYAWGERWTSILQQKLESADVRVIEDGLCGRTTVFDDALRPYRNGSKELPLSLEVNDKIDIAVVMIGTNDCKTYNKANASVIAKGAETLVRQIQNYDKNTKILLVSPIVLGEEVWREEYDPEFDKNSVEVSKGLKKTFKSVADKRGIAFLAASDFAVPSEVDMEHMSAESHRNLAEAIYHKVSALLAEDVLSA